MESPHLTPEMIEAECELYYKQKCVLLMVEVYRKCVSASITGHLMITALWETFSRLVESFCNHHRINGNFGINVSLRLLSKGLKPMYGSRALKSILCTDCGEVVSQCRVWHDTVVIPFKVKDASFASAVSIHTKLCSNCNTKNTVEVVTRNGSEYMILYLDDCVDTNTKLKDLRIIPIQSNNGETHFYSPVVFALYQNNNHYWFASTKDYSQWYEYESVYKRMGKMSGSHFVKRMVPDGGKYITAMLIQKTRGTTIQFKHSDNHLSIANIDSKSLRFWNREVKKHRKARKGKGKGKGNAKHKPKKSPPKAKPKKSPPKPKPKKKKGSPSKSPPKKKKGSPQNKGKKKRKQKQKRGTKRKLDNDNDDKKENKFNKKKKQRTLNDLWGKPK